MRMSKMDMINEGLEDWTEIQEIRGILRKQAATSWQNSTSPMAINEAKRRARAIGLSYWPALVGNWQRSNVDVKAYIYADNILAAKTGSYYGQTMPDGSMSHGGWDSYGRYGISAQDVRLAWFASGCKTGDKFGIQIRTGVVAKKYMSVKQTADYCRGYKWLAKRNMNYGFSTKAIVAIGRLSPEFRALAVQYLPHGKSKYRIVDLRWDLVKAGQDFLARFTNERDRTIARAMLCITTSGGGENLENRVFCGARHMREALNVTSDNIVEFVSRHNLGQADSTDLFFGQWEKECVLITRGHLLYHPSVRELIGPSILHMPDVAATIMNRYDLELAGNTRGLFEAILNAIKLNPQIELDDLVSYGKGMAILSWDIDDIPPLVLDMATLNLFIRTYNAEPQMVHAFRPERYSFAVDARNCDSIREALLWYMEGKIRKALTHPCMPKMVIVNRDFGFNMSLQDATQYEAVNAKAINAVAKAHGWELVRKYPTDTIRLTNALGMESVGIVGRYAMSDPEETDAIHSIVNELMPDCVMRPLSQQWNQFFAKHTNMLRYAGRVPPEMPVPVSVEAFIKEMAKFKYRRGLEASAELLDLASRLDMSDKKFETYLDYIKNTPTKTYEMLPFVRVDGSQYPEIGSEYVLEKMHFNDIAQLSIGEETACCQHLGGVGASSAKHSYQEPSSATYVLRKNGNIVAEAWVWRNDSDGVVIDSIEGRKSVSAAVVANAFYQMAVQLIGKLCIKKVFIATTNYGFTRDARNLIPPKEKIHSTKMIKSCGYMDGEHHHVWISAKMLDR